MCFERMSATPLTVRNMGAPAMMLRSARTSAGADMGMERLCPSMTTEQMLAVKPSELARVGMATKGMPMWKAL